MDGNRTADVKPRISEDAEKIRSWKLAEIVNSGHLKALRLPDSTSAVSKVHCYVVQKFILKNSYFATSNCFSGCFKCFFVVTFFNNFCLLFLFKNC